MEYTSDKEALTHKHLELLSYARDILGADRDDHAEQLIKSFCKLSPPQDPPFFLDMVTVDKGGRRGGHSRKPGNITLNWRNVVRESADLVLTGVGSISQPWLIPLAALSIFNKVWTQATKELTKEQASCLFAMWNRCDDNQKIDHERAFATCNELFTVFGWPALNPAQFSAVLNDLIELKCIKKDKDGVIWLREQIRKTYF